MPKARVEVPQLEEKVKAGKKKFVSYAEGAEWVCQVKCVSSFLHLFPQPSAV